MIGRLLHRLSPCIRASVVGLFLLVASANTLAADLAPARAIPVLDGGRVKPLDTLARESIRLITGRENFRNNDPLALTLAIQRDPVAYESQPLIHVPYLTLRTMLGLSGDAQHATPTQVRSSEALRKLVAGALAKQRAAQATNEDPALSREETAALQLADRLHAYDTLATGQRFAILPGYDHADHAGHSHPPFGESTPWRTVDTLAAATDEPGKAAFAAWQSLLLATHPGSTASASAQSAAGELAKAAMLSVGTVHADASLMSREVAYHRIHPFRIALVVYLLSLAVLCTSLMLKNPWVYRSGMVLLIGGIVLSSLAFAWRCSITGWAPVTNIYETVIWVALIGAIVAVCLEFAHGGKTAAIAGSLSATAASLVADIMPPEMGAAVQNLAPVLRSNLWLTVHVLTIVSSYAAFLVALVLGNILLYQFARGVAPSAPSAALNLRHLKRSIEVGVLLVAAGTILGGLWADVSWGRFWAWDPKEVWALIILLVYLALLHGRFAGWVGPWGLAAGAVGAFLTVLMSWYGVNFVLGAGLHSYGFGTGGQLYVGLFTLAQLAYLGACAVARRAHTRRSDASGRVDNALATPGAGLEVPPNPSRA
jgi:ABC-type transport system involved in cytochrome c biogenesis permease subunit